jgi:prolyl-tRNA editing enzyme YbaK/EbsC (Cys-tRNA(Pro) deacylase)
MQQYESKLKKFIDENGVDAEQVFFDSLVDHKDSVLETIKGLGINFDDIVKTVVFIDQDKSIDEGNAVVAIVPATSRVNRARLKELCNSRIKIAGSEEVLKLTGYPAGGVPPLGFKARFYMHTSLVGKQGIIYAGGGSAHALLKTKISQIIKYGNPLIENIIE